jgi:hypothetical protein
MASATTRPKRPRKKARKAPSKPLTNAQLLKLAAKHRPPQSWFDETDLPFTPTKD